MDYYSVLGVAKTASQDEIKRAYRKLAAQHHPDRGGDTAKFQDIQAAYDTLSDIQRRQHYDMHGSRPNTNGPQMGPGGFHFEFGPGAFEDIFANFGFQRQQRRQTYSAVVFVDLEQVAVGGTKNLQLNFPQGQKILEIEIPRGVSDGETIRYDNIFPDASLIIQFRVSNHPKYNRHGADLHMNVTLNVFDLIIGTKLMITDIYGKDLEISIAPKTKIGATLRCAGRGLVSQRGVGDLYILISAQLPDIISDDLVAAITKEVKGKTND